LVASHLVNFTLGQATSFCNPNPLKCTGTTTTLDRSSNPFDGVNIEWGAKPVAVDWDGDGDIDLLVGNHDGRIQFFERTADASLVERTGSSNPFDGIDVGTYAAPCAVDWDGDGDIDLLVGNYGQFRIFFFERSADASLIERTGSSNPFDGIIDILGGYVSPSAVDWDGDGDIDLLVGNRDGRIQFFERNADASLVQRTGSSNPFDGMATLTFLVGNRMDRHQIPWPLVVPANPFDGINAGDYASPFAVDWDEDGDIDLLVGNRDGRIQFFERSADASLIEQTGNSKSYDGKFDGSNAQPFAVDWDGDGDIDLLVAIWDGRRFLGRIQFFERSADASLIERTGSSNPFDGIIDILGGYVSPSAVDWDGDGDIDLLVGNRDGRIQFFERNADASLVQRTGSSNPFDGIDVGTYAAPCAVDWDGDGDIDLLVGNLDGRIQLFERNADASLVERTGSSNPFDGIEIEYYVGAFAAPCAVDWDGDGDIDLLVANRDGRIRFFERDANASLIERTGSSNPFDSIDVGTYAAPCAVDWDGDGDIDLLVCNTDSGIQFFSSEPLSCEVLDPCSRNGICPAAAGGACVCLVGYDGADCSVCAGGYYSEDLSCVPCPGLISAEGTCSGRGHDEHALSNALWSTAGSLLCCVSLCFGPSDITPGPKSILGSGSFGIVVKGMLNYTTEVAIKIPKTRFQSREESQLANEMRLFRHIRHSNIVLFHGATLMVINGGSPCLGLVLEWVNGGNFGEYMQQLRSNAVFEAVGHAFAYKILLDVARGMTYLHKLTPVILHLDLKPANILVEKSVPPKGKITDFGLSRFARNSLPQPKVGTEKYMAPEVAQRKPYGPAADVFSFGRVIIWTITGELCPELISSTSFKGQEDACLFQTLDEVASSCLEEEPHMRPHFFQVYDRLTTPPPTTTTTKIVPTPTTTKIVL
ncbi:unnamed protein product, partial [Polarella glacialis]